MTLTKLLNYLPRGHLLDDDVWHRRHKFLLWILGLHLPVMFAFGLALDHSLATTLYMLIFPALCVVAGANVRHRRTASVLVTAGLVYTAAAFTVLSHGTIEAHFHFFVIIGLIALYQDWVPFMWNIVFTMISHVLGSAWQSELIFNHQAGQNSPWLWSLIHGSAIVAACIGVVVFWRETEDEQQKTLNLTTQLAEAEINQRKFTSDLLVNLARRNQSMLYRQLDIINQLEEKERDPDALSELFRLDHLATRIRRNAESLLVLSGEEPTRVWSEPVRLIDVVRAAIAETEDLDRVSFAVDERMAVHGHTVTDLTHVLAELTENAVRFSPPEANVTIRTRPYLRKPGTAMLTVEDWGVGMRPDDMAAANDLLAHPREVDLSVSQRLGLHVVARLAARHDIQASLTPTPGTGVTAVVVLPTELFAENPQNLTPQRLMMTGVGPQKVRSPTPRPPSTPPPPAAQSAPMPSVAPIPPVAPVTQQSTPAIQQSTPPTDPDISVIPDAPATPVTPVMPVARSMQSGPSGSVPAEIAPDIPTPRRAEQRSGHGGYGPWVNSSGGRGMHTQPQQDGAADWSGWWTPTRLPQRDGPDWPAHPVYAPVEPLDFEDPPPAQPAPAQIVPTAALPAGPNRPDSPIGPTIIARNTTEPTAGSAALPVDVGSEPRLTRRVPQANLAPELRRGSLAAEIVHEPTAPPDAERARDALSRFQASRQTAQQQVGADGSATNGNGQGRSS